MKNINNNINEIFGFLYSLFTIDFLLLIDAFFDGKWKIKNSINNKLKVNIIIIGFDLGVSIIK